MNSPFGSTRLSTLGPSRVNAFAGGGGPVDLGSRSGAPTTAIIAPMGIADFGYSDYRNASTFHNYTTSAFRGTVHISSLNANASSNGGNWTGFQLNVVIPFTNGTTTILYWFQDVVNLNTSTGLVYFFNNIWNFSGSLVNVTGNGSQGLASFYYDGAPSDAPGMLVNLTFPVNISVELDSSVIDGVPHVAFLYDDGYGWVSYDNVSMPWARGWIDPGFPVQEGKYYHVEFVFGGPFGGEQATVFESNMTFELSFFNGHNFQPVITAWDFGSYTAEAAADLSESPALNGTSGVPSALAIAGTENPGLMYSRDNISLLNLTTPVLTGTLVVNRSATPYVGGEVNLTLSPGAYRIALVNQSGTVATHEIQLTAGEYLAMTLYPDMVVAIPTANRSSADVGQLIRFATDVSGGGGGFAYSWSGLPIGCAGSGSSIDCRTADSGTFAIRVLVTDSIGAQAESPPLAFTVYPLPVMSAPLADRSTVDVGQAITFTSTVTEPGAGGDTIHWNWIAPGPDAMTCAGSLLRPVCTANAAGSYAPAVSVRDQNGGTGTTVGSTVTVYSDPAVSAVSLSVSTTDVGMPVDFSVSTAGGSGSLHYAWTGLPPGCSSTQPEFTCRPQFAGSDAVGVMVTDSDGFAIGSNVAILVVNRALAATMDGPTGAHPTGETLTWIAAGTGGTPPDSYEWTFGDGWVARGSAVEHAYERVGAYTVHLWVNDSVGGSTAAQSNVTITSPPRNPPVTTPVRPPSLLGPEVAAMAIVCGTVVLSVLLIRSRRARSIGGRSPRTPGQLEPPQAGARRSTGARRASQGGRRAGPPPR
ncbi:MAG: thermopsin family protease [Thermoplasmata archaeon]